MSKTTPHSAPHRGLFITTEGIDGGGKTGLIRSLSAWLASNGIPCLTTREPGGNGVSQAIRELLLDPEQTWTPRAELMLYLADRAQHVSSVILPALNDGKVVLCDRYIDSTYAYQAWGRNMDKAAILSMCAFVARDAIPDVTLLLDIPPEQARERLSAAGKGDRMDMQSPLFYRRAREGFWELADNSPRIMAIDATQTHDQVLACAQMLLRKALAKRYGNIAPCDAELRIDRQGEHDLFRVAC